MRSTPTAKDTTGEAPETRADSVPSRDLALPECERLAGSRADWSDYPERTLALERLNEILFAIEDAIALDDFELQEHIAGFADAMQGLDSPADRVRFDYARVERAARHVKGAKHPERTANRLIFDLELSDPRYGALGTVEVLAHLRKVKVVSSPGAGPGRGKTGVQTALAALMVEVGAHDVTSLKDAKRKIKDANKPRKTKPPVRPSDLRRLREE